MYLSEKFSKFFGVMERGSPKIAVSVLLYMAH
ncbi:hypothetical protein APH_1362 [Anaplasma phagocytophilum str. HZ]|uniref:Uncharacterized protein n=1 Tax=Anaplasma phagocytophilum (strain HZ) TaxID=212042 RepID=Q2GIE0_ANAPZ|nr:hypothetical protein APH_1362 [Anaplasma phagocytophilum str. HZ]